MTVLDDDEQDLISREGSTGHSDQHGRIDMLTKVIVKLARSA